MILTLCRKCAGASTRLIRATCWVGCEGFGGWWWKLQVLLEEMASIRFRLLLPFSSGFGRWCSWVDLKMDVVLPLAFIISQAAG
jgi:hypothetical protein